MQYLILHQYHYHQLSIALNSTQHTSYYAHQEIFQYNFHNNSLIFMMLFLYIAPLYLKEKFVSE
nr:MAG TPA: hypothetical protein [Caudoviricetes sp.]